MSPARNSFQPSTLTPNSKPAFTSRTFSCKLSLIHIFPEPKDTLLVVEVTEFALSFYRDVKLPLYARTGILEVWIDVYKRQVQGCSDSGGLPNVYTAYQRVDDPAVRDLFQTTWGVPCLLYTSSPPP